MSLLRIPVVNVDQLNALRSLLRLDFTRCVRKVLVENTVVPLQCVKILQFTELMNQAEQPLIVVAALMQYHGTPTAMLPLDAARFDFFSKLLSVPLSPHDFPGLTDEQLEAYLTPMKNFIEELKKVFESSGHIDEQTLRSKMKTSTPASGMMN